jgi:hypothetical protein
LIKNAYFRPQTMPCECTGPGYCSRHQRPKSFSEWKKCQADETYRHLLDEDVKAPIKTTGGVGTEIKLLLAGMGFEPGPNCNCHEHQANWDKNGIKWCKDNRQKLVAALNEEAAARGFLQAAMAKSGGSLAIVAIAIANAERKGISV